MMEANEINPNVSEAELTAVDDDKEDNSVCAEIPKGERTLKGLTMAVRRHASFGKSRSWLDLCQIFE